MIGVRSIGSNSMSQLLKLIDHMFDDFTLESSTLILKSDSLSLYQFGYDGQAIYYEQDSKLMQLNLETKEETTLISENVHYFVYSQSDHRIYYTNIEMADASLFIYNINGGSTTELIP